MKKKKKESVGMLSELPAASRHQRCPVFAGRTSEPELPVRNVTSEARVTAAGRQRGEWILTAAGSWCSEPCSRLPTLPRGAQIISISQPQEPDTRFNVTPIRGLARLDGPLREAWDAC